MQNMSEIKSRENVKVYIIILVMTTFDNFLHASGIVLIILISASIVTYTSKFILRSDKLKKPPDLIYDPDHGANITAVCIFTEKLYSTTYDESPCHNKTLVQWYNPWLRHSFWMSVWNKIKMRNRLREVGMSRLVVVNATEPPNVPDDSTMTVSPKKEELETQKPKEKRVEFVYSLLVGLLIVSMFFACWEVFKDRLKKNAGAVAKSQEPECTLADFTINRHRRRESQQQQAAAHLPRQASFESTAKVTQTLIHQSSLDRAFPKTISEVMKSMKERRNSVPSCLNTEPQISVRNTPTKLTKRQSVDVLEDICLDPRKKSRHLIRRH